MFKTSMEPMLLKPKQGYMHKVWEKHVLTSHFDMEEHVNVKILLYTSNDQEISLIVRNQSTRLTILN